MDDLTRELWFATWIMNALDLFFPTCYTCTFVTTRHWQTSGRLVQELNIFTVYSRRKERSEFNQNVRFFDVIAAVESVRPKVDAFMQFDPATNGSTLMYNLQACAVTLAASSSSNFSRCVADNPTYWNERSVWNLKFWSFVSFSDKQAKGILFIGIWNEISIIVTFSAT